MNRDALKLQLRKHEGVRAKPYRDTVGKVTIGVGRNLDDRGLKPSEIEMLLDNDVDDVLKDIELNLPWFATLSEARQLVIANMVFNLGITRFLQFNATISAIRNGRFGVAADQMLASKWARQVGQRARDLAAMMRDG